MCVHVRARACVCVNAYCRRSFYMHYTYILVK